MLSSLPSVVIVVNAKLRLLGRVTPVTSPQRWIVCLRALLLCGCEAKQKLGTARSESDLVVAEVCSDPPALWPSVEWAVKSEAVTPQQRLL